MILTDREIQVAIDVGQVIVSPRPDASAYSSTSLDLTLSNSIRVEGKSSLARIGLGVHITAPTIHAGFKGTIQLEICNHGSLRVRLRAGMPVCQLILEQTLGTPVKGYGGQFYGQAAR